MRPTVIPTPVYRSFPAPTLPAPSVLPTHPESSPNNQLQINATTSTINTTTTSTSACYPSTVPDIDVCGLASSGISCPGAGANNFFYRCCSSAGHCGPKNNIQNQSLYCGDECQLGYGKCDTEVAPPDPTTAPGIAPDGEPCGPIVNKKCASGLCCSGSNYCGTGPDFCGSANWCQRKWGLCS